jgi:uncharacterized membrane protein
MSIFYNEIAGRSAERLGALSDGVFAFAMTLLVLGLRTPAASLVHTEGGLWHALARLGPSAVTYAMSFMTLGIFWIGQQTQLNKIKHSDRDLTWIHLAFLLTVTLLPFSTRLLTAFIVYRAALIVYWLNVAALGAALYWSWWYVSKAHLVADDAPPGIGAAVQRRIVVAQTLYAFGMLLSPIGTYWSIGFIMLAQLNYVFAPRLGILRKL